MKNKPSVCFYIINLKEAKDRLDFVQDQLNDFDFNIEIIEAVDGKLLRPPYQDYDEKKFNFFFGKKTNINVIAVFKSHLKALNEFNKSKYDIGIILEDDAKLPNNFNIYIDDIINTFCLWDLLRLSATRKPNNFYKKELSSGNYLSINLTLIKGMCAYAINKKGAVNLLNNLTPFYLPIDIMIENEWKFNIRSLCLYPFPIKDAFYHRINDNLKSQIPRGEKIKKFRLTAKIHNATQKLIRVIYRLIKYGIYFKKIKNVKF